jgi:Lectin C-type domain
MPVRWLVLAALLLCASCALFVDLGGLSDGAPQRDASAGIDAALDAGRTDPDAGVDAAKPPIKDAAALPDGSVVFPTNGHAYLIVVTPALIAWSDARSASLALGGHLATASSQAEQDFLLSLLARTSVVEVWIGGVQTNGASEPDGGWAWDNGELITLAAWGAGEPNNYADAEACMGLRADGWNDENCGRVNSTGYIVEFE